jgi:hypothetical protein
MTHHAGKKLERGSAGEHGKHERTHSEVQRKVVLGEDGIFCHGHKFQLVHQLNFRSSCLRETTKQARH